MYRGNVTAEEERRHNTGYVFPGDQSPYSPVQAVVIALVLMFVVVGTVVGNILVCVAVCLVRKLRRPCNYLLVSLAVSDLCVAILVMPMALLHEILGKWSFGTIVCDVWVSFDVISCTASILNLCMISVDRYYAITKPLEYGVKRTPRRMIGCVCMVWLGAACVSLPPLLILGNEHGKEGTECIVCQNFAYQIYATLGSFYIPLSVMIVVYHKIFQAAKRIVHDERKAQAHLKLKVEDVQCFMDKVVVTEISKNGSAPETRLATSPAKLTTSSGALAPSGGGNWTQRDRTSTTSTNTTVSSGTTRCFGVKKQRSSAGSDCPLTDKPGSATLLEQHQLVNRKKSQVSKTKLRFALARERKASTTLGIIMSAFIVCWLPFFVLALVRPFLNDQELIPPFLSSLFLWLGYANSLLNPIIYATLNRDFRKPFQEILCFRCSSLNLMMREEFYHSQYGDPDITIACPTTRYRGVQDDDYSNEPEEHSIQEVCPKQHDESFL